MRNLAGFLILSFNCCLITIKDFKKYIFDNKIATEIFQEIFFFKGVEQLHFLFISLSLLSLTLILKIIKRNS